MFIVVDSSYDDLIFNEINSNTFSIYSVQWLLSFISLTNARIVNCLSPKQNSILSNLILLVPKNYLCLAPQLKFSKLSTDFHSKFEKCVTHTCINCSSHTFFRPYCFLCAWRLWQTLHVCSGEGPNFSMFHISLICSDLVFVRSNYIISLNKGDAYKTSILLYFSKSY